MSPELFIANALSPALRLLPPPMDTVRARAMLLAICLQESQMMFRRQIGGPANSYLMFEKGGGVVGVLTHPASAALAKGVCGRLDYSPTADVVYDAIEHNDILACVFGRLLLWTLPQVLPDRTEPDKGLAQYHDAWKPGKKHPDKWPGNFKLAWDLVDASLKEKP